MSEVREAIRRADVVLSGGGGLLQNATSLRSVVYYAGILREAIRHAKQDDDLCAVDRAARFAGTLCRARSLCKGVRRATVRDARSVSAACVKLLPGTPVEQTADPVFLYDLPAKTRSSRAKDSMECAVRDRRA